MEETLVRLCHPHIMDVIGASLETTHGVTFHYEVIIDKGKVSVLEGTGLFMPDLKCRLFIPKDNLMDLQRLKKPEGSFAVIWEKSVLKISDHMPITINYDQKNHLPVLDSYKSLYSTAESLDMAGCVTSKNRHNLNQMENIFLQCHFKLGHTGFYTVQWIGRQGWLDNLGDNMGSNNTNIPKCSACHNGKQEINPKTVTRQSNDR